MVPAPAVTEPDGKPRRRVHPLFLTAAGFMAAYFVAVWMQETLSPPPAGAVAIALLPTAALALFIVTWVRASRELDELQRRIQLEALVVAFPGTILLAIFLGFLQRGGLLPEGTDLRDMWGFLPWPYFVGLLVARRRYL